MRLWQSNPIWLNSDSFLQNNNVNPSISYYIYKVAFLSTKPNEKPCAKKFASGFNLRRLFYLTNQRGVDIIPWK